MALLHAVGVSRPAAVLLVWLERVALAWFAVVVGGAGALTAAVLLHGSLVPDQVLLALRAGALTALVGLTVSAGTILVIATRVGAATLRDR